MALYHGESIRIWAQAQDPQSRQPLDPPPHEAWVSFWSPGRRPDRDPSLRDDPDFGPRAMRHRPEENDFVAYEPTDEGGWGPGRWTYEIRMLGEEFVTFEYGSVTIRE